MTFNNIINAVHGFLPVLPGTLFGLGGKAIGSSSQAEMQAKQAQEKKLQEQTELALKSAPTKEAYIQILAQKASYCNFKDKHALTKSDHFTCPAYQVQKTISYPNGIKAIVVVS